MSKKGAQLVIFDCDGVLVDSEQLANRVLTEAILELGLRTNLTEVTRRFKGRSLADCVRIIESDLAGPVPADFLSRLNAKTYAAFEAELCPIPGVEAVLANLRLPCCVASSGSHEKMRLTLGLTGLLERFDGKLFSATEVARGKPEPDLFLHAARAMRVPPEHCIVVEDSVPGVRAAVAAGMHVFGFAREEDPRALEEAGAVAFPSMANLPGLLESA